MSACESVRIFLFVLFLYLSLHLCEISLSRKIILNHSFLFFILFFAFDTIYLCRVKWIFSLIFNSFFIWVSPHSILIRSIKEIQFINKQTNKQSNSCDQTHKYIYIKIASESEKDTQRENRRIESMSFIRIR